MNYNLQDPSARFVSIPVAHEEENDSNPPVEEGARAKPANPEGDAQWYVE